MDHFKTAELAEIPDLWDVNVSDWSWDTGSSRFFEEGQQEPFISFVKQVTSKPVVGVGRFTSPDTMVSQLKRGVLDIIGTARPSIADPFIPRKIDSGEQDDIRECIGCNVCAAELMNVTKIRCTQIRLLVRNTVWPGIRKTCHRPMMHRKIYW